MIRNEDLKHLDVIAQTIFDKKGSNIIGLDVRGFSTMTDYYLIAEGHVDRHVVSLSRHIIDAMGDLGEKPLHLEGVLEGDWVVIDFGSIVVQLLTPEMREKYALEELWRPGKIVKLKIEVHNPQARGIDE